MSIESLQNEIANNEASWDRLQKQLEDLAPDSPAIVGTVNLIHRHKSNIQNAMDELEREYALGYSQECQARARKYIAFEAYIAAKVAIFNILASDNYRANMDGYHFEIKVEIK